MRWLNSKVFEGHRFSLFKQIVFFSILLCFLVVFNLCLAGGLTDPNPDWEHPWDDLRNTDPNENPPGPLGSDDWFILEFGFDFWIIFHLELTGQKDGLGEGKAFRSSEKNRGHIFILIK